MAAEDGRRPARKSVQQRPDINNRSPTRMDFGAVAMGYDCDPDRLRAFVSSRASLPLRCRLSWARRVRRVRIPKPALGVLPLDLLLLLLLLLLLPFLLEINFVKAVYIYFC